MTSNASATAHATTQALPKAAYDIVAHADPTRFYPKYGPLPGVVHLRDQSGTWDAVGRTRTLGLSDGGHVVETITDAESPTHFAYELSDFQKIFGMLVTGARAEWRFDVHDGGTRIRWTYTFRGKRGRAWLVKLIVTLWWAPYMLRVLPPIAAVADAAAD